MEHLQETFRFYALNIMGGMLVLLVVYDILMTILYLRGGGPVSQYALNFLWHGFCRLPSIRRIFNATGLVLLVCLLLAWFIGFSLGWNLIFASSPESILAGQSRIPSGWVERVYFVGYTISTLGIGDYVPNGTYFQIATIVASSMGYSFLTLVVAYIISVVSAVSQKRTLTENISLFGQDAFEMEKQIQDGGSVEATCSNLKDLHHLVIAVHQRVHLFPIIMYYLNSSEDESFSISLSEYMKMLFLLEDHDSKRVQAVTRRCLTSLHKLLLTLANLYVLPNLEEAQLKREMRNYTGFTATPAEEMENSVQLRDKLILLALRLYQFEGREAD